MIITKKKKALYHLFMKERTKYSGVAAQQKEK